MNEMALPQPAETFQARISVSPLALTLIAVLVTLCADGFGGFKMLDMMGIDNDSQVRLVEVRDLLAGQGWFDLHQYRLGVAEGTSMHWSRLVDAPIALIIWLTTLVTGSQATGETVALILWPALTFIAALYVLLRAVRRFAGTEAMIPAVVIGGFTLYRIGIFSPGALDHHNVELALTLAILTFLLESIDRPKLAALAGVAATLALSIGMETAGYVAFAGIAVSGWFLFKGEKAWRQTAAFGAGFAGTALVTLLLTRSPSQWLSVECDAYSVAQFAVAVVAGAGIAGIAGSKTARSSMPRRLVALAVLGVVLGALLVTAFPQCLAAPYSDVEPRLRDYWMSSITEAQPIWSMVRAMPIAAANYYPVIIVAVACLGWQMYRNGSRLEDGLVVAFLLPAALVSFYQLRGANFALGFSVVPLAAMIAAQRSRLADSPTLGNNLRAVAAWLVSINIIWMLLTVFVISNLSPQQAELEKNSLGGETACLKTEDFATLATLPPARILAVANLGSSILRHTGHHPLAAPYHRNVAGNLLTLDVLSAKPDAARTMIVKGDIDLVAVCRGNSESDNFPEGSLQSELTAGRAPAWLERLLETDGAYLEIYRLLPN